MKNTNTKYKVSYLTKAPEHMSSLRVWQGLHSKNTVEVRVFIMY